MKLARLLALCSFTLLVALSFSQAPSVLSVSPKVAPPGNRTGTVTLTAAAPAGGLAVTLSSNSAAAVVPPSVTVAQGATFATFPISTHNSGYTNLIPTITATGSSVSKTATLTVNPANTSSFVGQTVPGSMVAGAAYLVTLQFKNTGSTTWDAAHYYRLMSRNPADNMNWGTKRLRLLSSPVAPGETGTFTGQVNAPAIPGTYDFQWMCVQDDIFVPFGPASNNLPIVVTPGTDDSQFMSQQGVPTRVLPGSTFNASLTFKNIGTSIWRPSSGYSLRSVSPFGNTTWGTSEIPLSTVVGPGGLATFTKTFTVPTTVGTYYFQWAMVHNSAFGQRSAGVYIVVVRDDAAFVSQTVPMTVFAGQQFYPQYSFKNTGATTWSSATGYWSVSFNPRVNTTWGITRGHLPGNLPVAPGQTVKITPLVTAPSIPGFYTMQWIMSRTDLPFGKPTDPLVIEVLPQNPEGAKVTAQTIPIAATAGQHYVAQITFRNNGSADWPLNTAVGIYPGPGNKWGLTYLKTGSVIKMGNSRTYTLDMLAPYTPGNYDLQFRMRDMNSNAWFGEASGLATVTVSPSFYAQSPWPGARGGRDRFSGRGYGSGATGVPLWTFDTGVYNSYFRSELAIGADGTVYAGCDDHSVYALNGATGAKKWSVDMGAIVVGAPAIGADGTVYVGSTSVFSQGIKGKFCALDGATGAEKWSFSEADSFLDASIGPEGTVYVGTSLGKLRAFNGASGAIKWTVGTLGTVQCAPAIAADGTLYVLTMGKLTAVDPTSGAVLWDIVLPDGGGVTSAATIGVDGTIYVATQRSRVYALDPGSRTIKWTFFTAGMNVRGPAIGADGTIYCGATDHKLYAIDGSTGLLKWTYTAVSEIFTAPSIGADGTVYFGDYSKLYAIDGTTGTEKFSVNTGPMVWSAVSIGADGTLYFGLCNGTLRAIK